MKIQLKTTGIKLVRVEGKAKAKFLDGTAEIIDQKEVETGHALKNAAWMATEMTMAVTATSDWWN